MYTKLSELIILLYYENSNCFQLSMTIKAVFIVVQLLDFVIKQLHDVA